MAEQFDHKNERLKCAKRLVYNHPLSASLLPAVFEPADAKSVLIESLYSGISRGTESLVYQGKVPESEWQTMRCPHQIGEFSFPLSYGYQLVGKVLAIGEEVENLSVGDVVFTLHPHQTLAIVSETMANKVPDNLPAKRAILSANMETALNAVWDSGAKQGQQVSVIGAGVVGLLTAYVAQQHTKTSVTIIDIDEGKRRHAEALGLFFSQPNDAPSEQDIVFHASASSQGLQKALDICTFEGRVIEMSWYGEKPVTLNLGGVFHSKRLQIISSQVGHVSPAKRQTTSYSERMRLAMSYLDNPALDGLIEEAIAFTSLPDHLDEIFGADSGILCQAISYRD